MRRRYMMAGAALLVAALAAGWYFASPGWTLYRMVGAAKSNDMALLASYVDFQALRDDLKADYKERIAARARSDSSQTGQMAVQLAMSMLGAAAQVYASPEGVRSMIALLDDSDAPPGSKQPGKMKIERTGFDSFRVVQENVPGRGFIFGRSGLGWKLIGMDLPPEPQLSPAVPGQPAER